MYILMLFHLPASFFKFEFRYYHHTWLLVCTDCSAGAGASAGVGAGAMVLVLCLLSDLVLLLLPLPLLLDSSHLHIIPSTELFPYTGIQQCGKDAQHCHLKTFFVRDARFLALPCCTSCAAGCATENRKMHLIMSSKGR